MLESPVKPKDATRLAEPPRDKLAVLTALDDADEPDDELAADATDLPEPEPRRS